MKNNIVELELPEYLEIRDELKEYKKKSEDITFNFDNMCCYICEQISESNKYHIQNVIEDKLDLDERLNKKLKNYHYESLFNEFIKVGITFDLIERLTDKSIIEYMLEKDSDKE